MSKRMELRMTMILLFHEDKSSMMKSETTRADSCEIKDLNWRIRILADN